MCALQLGNPLGGNVAEVLVEYPDLIKGDDGRTYTARACGVQASENSWHGWIEFEPIGGGEPLRSPRETTQPNLVDARYWATGLTPVYLEGALRRALHPLVLKPAPPLREPAFDGPAPEPTTPDPSTDAVLNPFSVYQKGETLLRRQLSAFSSWHLVNIVRAYGIPVTAEGGQDPERLPSSVLIEAIVQAARKQARNPVAK